jgi:ribosome-binding protein aMBF1 (putative translation factor)
MERIHHHEAAQLVRSARQKLKCSQHEFADSIKRSQGVVSKYESGKVSPPSDVVMHCMHIVNSTQDISGERAPMSDPRWQAVSSALNQLNRALEALKPL